MAVPTRPILRQFNAFAAMSQIWRNPPHNRGRATRLLRGVLAQLDQSLENASEGIFQANRNFAQASRDIEAVQAGRQAATRGRSEDLIPAHQALWPEAQAAFRAGYVDPLIAQTQGAAFGVNKARPFLNDAVRDEAAAMAPGNSLMQRRRARGQTMFETRGHALGGSRTMDNMNDHDALARKPPAFHKTSPSAETEFLTGVASYIEYFMWLTPAIVGRGPAPPARFLRDCTDAPLNCIII